MTARVDFYILSSATAQQRFNFACRLTEKAYLRDLKVVVLCGAAGDAQAIDDLLWTFSERSFVPHEILRETGARDAAATATAAPVQLTADLQGVGQADLLVNLSAELPADLDRFSRIAEVIDADDDRRRLGRERFKAYRELKLPLETHQLSDTVDV
jgi:DNA polymerase III subunit chi